MNESRLERWAPLSGALSVLLAVAGALMIDIYDYLPAAEKVADHLTANSLKITAGGYIGALSAFFLIWFAGSVFKALQEQESGSGWLSAVSFGGGTASAVTMLFMFTSIGVAAQRAGAEGGIDPVGAITLHDLWGQLGGMALPVCLAVFVAGVAIVSLRTGLFPRWFGWLSVVIAIGLISPISYLFVSIGWLWVLVVSIWLFAKGRKFGGTAASAEGTE